MATPEEIKLKFKNGLIPDENDFAALIDIVSDTAALMLPSQEGASGQFLTTDGTSASWGTVDMASKEDVGVAANLDSAHVSESNPHPQYYFISDATSSLDLKWDKAASASYYTKLETDNLFNIAVTGEVKSVNNVFPEAGGALTLTAADVSAVDKQFTINNMPMTGSSIDIPEYQLIATINGYEVSGNPILNAADVSAQPIGNYSVTGHGHTIPDVDGLQTALDSKAPTGNYSVSGHGHSIGDVATLQSTLDSKATTAALALKANIASPQFTGVVTLNSEVSATFNATNTLIDWSNTNKRYLIVNNSITALTFSANPPKPTNLTLKLINNVGTYTIGSWAATTGTIYKFQGTVPQLTTTNGHIDIIGIYFDGTNYFIQGSSDFY